MMRALLRACVVLGVAACLLVRPAEGSGALLGFVRPHADAHLELDGVHERAIDPGSDSSRALSDESLKAQSFQAIQRTPSASVLKSFWEDFAQQNFDDGFENAGEGDPQGGGGEEHYGSGGHEVYYDYSAQDHDETQGCLPKGFGDLVGGIKNCWSGEAHIYEVGADGSVERVRSPKPVERKKPAERRQPASRRTAWCVARTLSPMDLVRTVSGVLRFSTRGKEKAMASADRMDTEAVLRATRDQMATLRGLLDEPTEGMPVPGGTA